MNNLIYAAEVILCTCARDEVRAVERLSLLLHDEIRSNRVTAREMPRAIELLTSLEEILQARPPSS